MFDAIFRKRIPLNSGLSNVHHAVFYPVGAGNAVYEPAYPIVPAMLPVVNISGNGILAGRAPNPNQPPQVYANQASFVAGIGGVLAGQIFGQPLQIPETTNGSQ